MVSYIYQYQWYAEQTKLQGNYINSKQGYEQIMNIKSHKIINSVNKLIKNL